MACPVEGLQVYVRDTAYFDVVECQCTFDMSDSSTLVEICLAEICCTFVYPHSQVSSTARSSKFNEDVPHLFDTLLEFFKRWFGASDCNWMITCRETLYEFIH